MSKQAKNINKNASCHGETLSQTMTIRAGIELDHSKINCTWPLESAFCEWQAANEHLASTAELKPFKRRGLAMSASLHLKGVTEKAISKHTVWYSYPQPQLQNDIN